MIGKRGFTLIEILVVVLIIGILAAIALPQYQMAVAKARLSTLKDNARVIKDAMDRYYLVHDVFSDNLSALDIDLGGTIRETQAHYIDLTDGSVCYIGGSSIFCNRKIFNVKTEYSVEFRNFMQRKHCIVYSKDLNDKSNRLCQQETGKDTPALDGNGYNSYRY